MYLHNYMHIIIIIIMITIIIHLLNNNLRNYPKKKKRREENTKQQPQLILYNVNTYTQRKLNKFNDYTVKYVLLLPTAYYYSTTPIYIQYNQYM